MKSRRAKPVKSPVVDRRYQQAVELFERAAKALGKKDFDRASELFDQLLDSHADQSDLVERARTYRALSERSRRTARPRTFEELLNYGVVLHNRGDFAHAVKYLQQALDMHPRNESALYCLEAAQARAGDTPAALKALKSCAVSVGLSMARDGSTTALYLKGGMNDRLRFATFTLGPR